MSETSGAVDRTRQNIDRSASWFGTGVAVVFALLIPALLLAPLVAVVADAWPAAIAVAAVWLVLGLGEIALILYLCAMRSRWEAAERQRNRRNAEPQAGARGR